MHLSVVSVIFLSIAIWKFLAFTWKYGGAWVYLYLFIYFIYWSFRTVALVLYYHSVAPCTCKDDISSSVICYLYFTWLIYRWPKSVSSCCFGGLSCNFSFWFVASRIHSTNGRKLIVSSSLLSIIFLIYNRSLNWPFWLRIEINCFF